MKSSERRSYNELVKRFIENCEADTIKEWDWIGVGPKTSSEFRTKVDRLFRLVGLVPLGLNVNQSIPPVCMNYGISYG